MVHKSMTTLFAILIAGFVLVWYVFRGRGAQATVLGPDLSPVSYATPPDSSAQAAPSQEAGTSQSMLDSLYNNLASFGEQLAKGVSGAANMVQQYTGDAFNGSGKTTSDAAAYNAANESRPARGTDDATAAAKRAQARIDEATAKLRATFSVVPKQKTLGDVKVGNTKLSELYRAASRKVQGTEQRVYFDRFGNSYNNLQDAALAVRATSQFAAKNATSHVNVSVQKRVALTKAAQEASRAINREIKAAGGKPLYHDKYGNAYATAQEAYQAIKKMKAAGKY
jgi:hypothetical protein